MKKTKEPILVASRVEYIDPLDCASRVGFRFWVSEFGHLSGEVNLNECSRQITWRLGSDYATETRDVDGVDHVAKKLKNAIEIMNDALRTWRAAKAKYQPPKKKAKKK